MRMIPVRSSQIKAAGWEAGILRVQFTKGTIYEYEGVSEQWFRAFLAAPSKGKFFVGIKKDPKAYPFRKVVEHCETCSKPATSTCEVCAIPLCDDNGCRLRHRFRHGHGKEQGAS